MVVIITARGALLPSWRSRPCQCSLQRDYEFVSQEVEIPIEGSDATASAYLTEEVPRKGAQRPSRAVLLLPGAHGFAAERTRRLADRLALFCFAMVLVPDVLQGGQPWPSSRQLPRGSGGSEELAAWASGSLPPKRVSSLVRSATVYLRADHRVETVALVGAGLGGNLVLRALAEGGPPLRAAAGVALCPLKPRLDELRGLSAPVLLLFDRSTSSDDAATDETRDALALPPNLSAAPVASPFPVSSSSAAASSSSSVFSASATETEVVVATNVEVPATVSALRRMRVGELRDLAAELGLPTHGTKPDLVERLRGYVGAGGAAAAQSEAATPQSGQEAAATTATATGAAPSARAASPAPPPSQPMVRQFRGLGAYCATLSHGAAGAADRSLEDDADLAFDSGSVDGAVERRSEEAEDGMLFAEAWINLHA